MQIQQPIKHLFNVLGVMDSACTALVISITQNSVSHPSLRCHTLFTQHKKLNCCEKLGYSHCFSHTTHSQMAIKLKQVLLLKKNSQLTPWSTVLVKPTLPQLAKKFPAFYGTQRFITHLSLLSVR